MLRRTHLNTHSHLKDTGRTSLRHETPEHLKWTANSSEKLTCLRSDQTERQHEQREDEIKTTTTQTSKEEKNRCKKKDVECCMRRESEPVCWLNETRGETAAA